MDQVCERVFIFITVFFLFFFFFGGGGGGGMGGGGGGVREIEIKKHTSISTNVLRGGKI